MFRTRDFLLLFSVIAFLIFAIGGTVLMRFIEERGSDTSSDLSNITPANTEVVEYGATVSVPDTISRDERLASMRQKIAAQAELVSAPTTPEGDMQTETTTTSNLAAATTTEATVAVERRCQQYRMFAGDWDAREIEMKVTNQTREWYESVEKQFLTATSGELGETFTDEETRLVVALYPNELGEYCLPGDVIGVATDGSLIRNTETALYGVFGENTLIGYALDGFPIYGSSARAADACGAVQVGAEYRYQVHLERGHILNCFSAPPSSSLYP